MSKQNLQKIDFFLYRKNRKGGMMQSISLKEKQLKRGE